MKRHVLSDADHQKDKFLNALAESFLLQDAILSSTELVVISFDLDGVITSFNRSAETMLGYQADDLIGKESPTLIHDLEEIIQRAEELTCELKEDIAPGIDVLIAKARRSKLADRKEWTYIRKNGTRFSVSLSLSGIWDESDVLSGFLGIATDITEQKKISAELTSSEEKFRTLAENIPGVVYLCRYDTSFSMMYLNQEVENLTGYTADEFITEKISFVTLYHPEDAGRIFEEVDAAIREKRRFHLQYRLATKSGEWKWIDEIGIGVYINDKFIILEGFLRDISERKRQEEELLVSKKNLEVLAEELQEQNRQLNDFAHIISHNLRSPVGNINALISLLRENSTIDDYKEVFKNLQSTSSNLQQTLNDLMETLSVKKEVLNNRVSLTFEDTLNKVKQDLAGEIIRFNTIIHYDFSKAQDIVYSKAYLESIFLNLLSNALKYRHPSRTPEIHFSSYKENGQTVLKVSDNGLGINLDRYGEKLFGLHQTFHEHPEARGVGLFLTKTQIEATGGKIHLESEENIGSTFYIHF